jgi:hypothetical protein
VVEPGVLRSARRPTQKNATFQTMTGHAGGVPSAGVATVALALAAESRGALAPTHPTAMCWGHDTRVEGQARCGCRPCWPCRRQPCVDRRGQPRSMLSEVGGGWSTPPPQGALDRQPWVSWSVF